MSITTTGALRAGFMRGAIDFRNSLQKPADIVFYVFGAVGFGAALWFLRDQPVDGAGISTADYVVPNVLALMTFFIASYGLATLVSTEREDGTILRLSLLPGGVAAYAFGQTVRTLLELAFTFAMFSIIASILAPSVWAAGPVGALTAVGFLLLGIVASLPFGFVLGALFANPRSVGGWGFAILGALVWVSGVIVPLIELPGWAQIVGQVLPLYWLGLGLRGALLPDELAAIEIGADWRALEAVGVLGLWAIIGLALAPLLLQRVSRRDTLASLAQRREKALQRA